MNDRDLFTALNGIDDRIIKESEKEAPARARARLLRVLLPAAALILVCALAVGGVMLIKKNGTPDAPATQENAQTAEAADETKKAVAATVYFDVNPSVGIDVDGSGGVYAVAGVNGDGEKLLLGAGLVGEKIEDAVAGLIARSAKMGYLTASQNAVLLSVRADDEALAHILSARLSQTASAALDALLPDGRVIAQTIDFEDYLKELNVKGRVSPGKAKYILDILGLTDEYAAEDLVSMNFTELLSLAESLGHPVGQRIKDGEAVDIAIKRFLQVYDPDAEARVDYVPWEIPDAPAGIQPTVRVLRVGTADGKELQYEIRVCIGSASADNEKWALDIVNLKGDGIVYQYGIDPETGKILYEKAFDPDRLSEVALELSVAFCGKTADDLVDSEIVDTEEQFLMYLLFCTEDGYDARNVLFDKESCSAVSGWQMVSANFWDAYRLRLINDDLHISQPDKDVKNVFAYFCAGPYVRCASEFEGGWHHCILDGKAGRIVYSEISGSEEVSAAFKEQIARCIALAGETEGTNDEICEPAD